MLVVADASPLIFLDRLEHLPLLPSLYDRVVVPRAVLDEVAAGAGEGSALAQLGSADWVDIGRSDENVALLAALTDDLDRGEASAIALARSLKADLVLIDERQGRRIARRLGLTVKGTLGLLVEAWRQGLVPELRPLLHRLRDEGAWLGDPLIQETLRAVGEEDA